MSKFSIADFRKRYPDDDTCLAEVFKARFGHMKTCPGCEKQSTYYRLRKRKCYQCGRCNHKIFPLSGTIFHHTTTPLTTWFYAIYMFSTSKNGVSSKELQRALGVTFKCAFRIGHKIREAMARDSEALVMKGKVEIDESLIGGKRSGGKRGWGAENKTCLFGIIERGGRVKITVVPNRERATLYPLIRKHVEKGATINTDEYRGYATLSDEGYKHKTVNHSKYEWRNKDAYTNSIEGYWSNLKKAILGTHTFVTPKYMPYYLGEFDFRHNHRKGFVIFDEVMKRATANSSVGSSLASK